MVHLEMRSDTDPEETDNWEYYEHQHVRTSWVVQDGQLDGTDGQSFGGNAHEFDPVEDILDRHEVAELVYVQGNVDLGFRQAAETSPAQARAEFELGSTAADMESDTDQEEQNNSLDLTSANRAVDPDSLYFTEVSASAHLEEDGNNQASAGTFGHAEFEIDFLATGGGPVYDDDTTMAVNTFIGVDGASVAEPILNANVHMVWDVYTDPVLAQLE